MHRFLLALCGVFATASAHASNLFEEFPPFLSGGVQVKTSAFGFEPLINSPFAELTVNAQNFEYVKSESAISASLNQIASASTYVSPNHFFGGKAAASRDVADYLGQNVGVETRSDFQSDYVDQLRLIAGPGDVLPAMVQLNFLVNGFMRYEIAELGTATFIHHGYRGPELWGGVSLSHLNLDNGTYEPIVSYSAYDPWEYGDDGGVKWLIGYGVRSVQQAVSISLPVNEVIRTDDGYTGGLAEISLRLTGWADLYNMAGSVSVDFDHTLQLTSLTLPEFGNRTVQEAGFQVELASGLSIPVPEPASFALAGFALATLFACAWHSRPHRRGRKNS